MRYLFIIFSLFTFSVMSQTIEQLSFDQLQKKILSMNDSIVVLNFWATWCRPCVVELPDFEKLNENYAGKKVKVLLVNLDLNSKVASVVESFVKNKNLKSQVLHITDFDPNTWINRIDSTWSGGIPATVIYNSSHNKINFKEGSFTYDELEKIIQPLLKKE